MPDPTDRFVNQYPALYRNGFKGPYRLSFFDHDKHAFVEERTVFLKHDAIVTKQDTLTPTVLVFTLETAQMLQDVYQRRDEENKQAERDLLPVILERFASKP